MDAAAALHEHVHVPTPVNMLYYPSMCHWCWVYFYDVCIAWSRYGIWQGLMIIATLSRFFQILSSNGSIDDDYMYVPFLCKITHRLVSCCGCCGICLIPNMVFFFFWKIVIAVSVHERAADCDHHYEQF